VFVVVASRFDVDAARLVERWHERGAGLLTCDGLSRRGWIHHPAAPERSWAVLDEVAVPIIAIRGVLSRLPRVAESELPGIVPEERAYVAAEMMAYLVAWLSSLPCRVLNRPSPLNLTGPSWHPEQWLREAKRAGLPTRRAHRVAACFTDSAASRLPPTASLDVAELPMSITVVGERCFGDSGEGPIDRRVEGGLRRLAAAARVELMTASFVRGEGALVFAGAWPGVDVSRPEIADAVLARMGIES
jgi:hypothetical protein